MGAVAGGIIGWLVNLGVPSEVAPYYEQGLNEGAIVLAVAAHPGDENRVEQILKGGSVAYSGHGVQPYVAPEYASRYSDVGPQPKAYDSVNNMQYNTAANAPEAQRTANSVEAEQRSDIRTAAEHEREARRDAERTNPVSGTVAAAENEWDRTKTAVQNQSDKVSTGAQNETDRLNRP